MIIHVDVVCVEDVELGCDRNAPPLQPSHLFDGFQGLPEQGGVLLALFLVVVLMAPGESLLPVIASLPRLTRTHTLGVLRREVCFLLGERRTHKTHAIH